MSLETTITEAELASLQAAALGVQIKEVDITSAEVLALNAAPKTLVPAPGPGNVIELLSAVLILDFNTAAYATNGTLLIQTTATNTALSDTVALAAFLAAVADQVTVMQPLSAEASLDVNEGIELFMPSAETITGDSPIKVRVAYRVHATGL